MRRTKIVATLGPASSDSETIEKLFRNGLDVVRLNFSHGTHDEHRRRLETVRAVSKQLASPVACLQDLSGPKIRTGPLASQEGVKLEAGATFTLTTEDVIGTSERVSTTYHELPKDARPGHRILLDDGLIELKVEQVQVDNVITRVVNGGVLKPRKGINLPGIPLSVASLTPKDREDLELGLSLNVDYMALSFVRSADDIRELKAILADRGRPDIPVIAKIEKPEAVENLTSILDVSDGVMVARGDLGVEMATEEVPTLQKKIIREANRRGRMVITATQMLESMVHNPRPTRAEASDVANAILDGTDAVMLSAETAVGRYPVETVATMARIAEHTEEHKETRPWQSPFEYSLIDRSSVSRAVAMASCRAADDLAACYVVVFTESGKTARLVSHFRPSRPILAVTPSECTYRRLALLWGVKPILTRQYDSVDEMLDTGLTALKANGRIDSGDTVVVIFGTSPLTGGTNMMKIHRF